jgi:hypothetical protein
MPDRSNGVTTRSVLDATTRAFFEPRFGRDFGQVRVHAGRKAAESSRSVNALAYVVEQEVVFGEGQYAPAFETGRRLLAHELAHTIQQRAVGQSPVTSTASEDESQVVGIAVRLRNSLQKVSPRDNIILRQPSNDESPLISQHRLDLVPDLTSPIQQRLNRFQESMIATYRTPDGKTADVSPPFEMAPGYKDQQAISRDATHQRHLNNVMKSQKAAPTIWRVQAARGNPEEIRTVIQALIDDHALDDEPSGGSLEQRIRRMIYNYMIGTDCAGYVQQAYLAAKGIERQQSGLGRSIVNENLSNLLQKGFTRVDPSAALPGDLIVLSPPEHENIGHRAIVYSQRPATANDKETLKKILGGFTDGGSMRVLEVDSSWGSGGNPELGGIQRRTWWYNPGGTPRWAWTEEGRIAFGDLP